jgi:cytochrome c oxidase subunit 2
MWRTKRIVLTLCVTSALVALSSVAGIAETRTERYFSLCAMCHGPQAGGNQALGAPAIAGLPAWYIEAQLTKFRTDVRGKHPGDIGGMRMRPMARTIEYDEDVKNIAAYVAGLPVQKVARTITGDVDRGKQRFTICIACHGPQAAGQQALKVPPLKTTNDWYQLTQLKNFKARIRAGNPAKDPVGAQMTAIAATLENEQVMRDLVAYINTLK